MGRGTHRRGSRQSAQRPKTGKNMRSHPENIGDPVARAKFQQKKAARAERKRKKASRRHK